MEINKTEFISLPEKKSSTTDVQKSSYLHKPSGDYSVGYRDIYCATDCKDSFFNTEEQKKFSTKVRAGVSKIGKKQEGDFREAMIRVYYPSTEKSATGDLYHSATIGRWQRDLASVPGIDIGALSEIQTYAVQDVKPAQGKTFPIIIFNPGIDSNAQEYGNVISELVSHGYIVVAVNNTFISRSVEFPDGRVVDGLCGLKDDETGAKDETISLQLMLESVHTDVNYVYRNITTLCKDFPIDTKSIGLLGHSLGGVLAVILAQKGKEKFQAVIALDAPADPSDSPAYDVRQSGKIPLLQIHASSWRKRYSGASEKEKGKATYSGTGKFDLQANNFHVMLAPTENEEDSGLTDHNIFSDFSTLQKYPALVGLAAGLKVGTQDGHKAIQTIGAYIVQFFDHFLKKQPQLAFSSGIAFTDTIMKSGLRLDSQRKAEEKVKKGFPSSLDAGQSLTVPSKLLGDNSSSLFHLKDNKQIKPGSGTKSTEDHPETPKEKAFTCITL